ncbi:MAG: hypothetical protein HQK89_08535 [Nitrospirae bacterium]|nr:hypothetical protein [Nitrospirota bacterium]
MKKLFENPDRGFKMDFDHKSAMNELEQKARDIFRRLDKQIEILEAIESSVDSKLAAFERLMQMSDSMNCSTGGVNRRIEVMALSHKGLHLEEIASVLGMQCGEVELILNLNL